MEQTSLDPRLWPPKPLAIAGILGRNGSDSLFFIPDHQCREAYNIDWFRSSLGRKRGGAAAIATAGGTAFANGVQSLFRFVPSSDETAAEFWAVDGSSRFHRLAGSAVWADPTVVDAISSNPQEIAGKSFNGKMYFAYDTVHNRLHCWDPATNSIRRVGLDLPPTPTLGAPSGGAVTDTRKYRVAWTVQSGGVTIRRSNLSVATASQALVAQQVVVTRGTLPNEGETHWELYAASGTFSDYRLIATTAVGTTTATDNTTPLPTTVSPAEGANTPPPSAKYIVADDARIIMAGAYEAATNPENAAAPKNNRVWWTSILGASDVGDDERVSLTGTINNYADLEEAITGISDPLQIVSAASSSLERGSFYVFSYRSQWKFVGTGDSTAPYLKFKVSGGAGCIFHKSIVMCEDEAGNPAIMWAAATSIMRISVNGQQKCGEDLVDLWATINLDATIPVHGVYYPALNQVWFHIATGSNLFPNKRVIFDTRLGVVTGVGGLRQGWAVHEGESTNAYCSCMFSATIGATMARSLKPYIGYTTTTAIWRCDTADLDDGGTAFQAYLDTKSYIPWGIGTKGGIREECVLFATPVNGGVIQLTLYRDDGVEALVSKVDLTDRSDSAAALKVGKKAEGSRLSDSFSFRARLGDSQAERTSWNLDALVVFPTNGGSL